MKGGGEGGNCDVKCWQKKVETGLSRKCFLLITVAATPRVPASRAQKSMPNYYSSNPVGSRAQKLFLIICRIKYP
jgi:hypothetical protein